MAKQYLYFPTRRKNLLSILSHGAILLPGCEYRHEEDVRDGSDGSIPLFEPPVPKQALYGPLSDVVLIKLPSNVIRLLKDMDSVSKEGKSYRINAPIPLMKAESYLFAGRSELKDFTLRMFEDIPLDESLLDVWSGDELSESETDDMFGGSERSPDRHRTETAGSEAKRQVSSWCLVDRALGAFSVASLVCDLSGRTPPFLESLLRIALLTSSGKEVSSTDLARLYEAPPDAQALDADVWIFNCMLSILSASSPEEGLVPDDVINNMIAKAVSAPESLRSDIRKWCSFVSGVIRGEKDVRSLGDSGKLAQRGALLFLLRPEVERIASANSASFSPGVRVQSLGCFLAGFWTGLARLGSEYKLEYSEHVRFVHYFTTLSSKVRKTGKVPNIRAEVESGIQGLSRQISLKHSRSVVFSRNVEIDPRLRTLFHFAQSAHYRMEFDFDAGCLTYRIKLPEGRSQLVRVCCIGEAATGEVDIVRFTSTCKEFKKSLSKEDANELLTRNNSLDMHCRFAIDPHRSEVVIQVDQRFRHMPTDAFHHHMEHVAEIADRYEQEVAGDKDTY